MAELEQRLFLDLPHALAGDAEQCPDILQSHRIFAVEAEVQPQNLRLALLQSGKRLLDRLRQRFLERLLVGSTVVLSGR